MRCESVLLRATRVRLASCDARPSVSRDARRPVRVLRAGRLHHCAHAEPTARPLFLKTMRTADDGGEDRQAERAVGGQQGRRAAGHQAVHDLCRAPAQLLPRRGAHRHRRQPRLRSVPVRGLHDSRRKRPAALFRSAHSLHLHARACVPGRLRPSSPLWPTHGAPSPSRTGSTWVCSSTVTAPKSSAAYALFLSWLKPTGRPPPGPH